MSCFKHTKFLLFKSIPPTIIDIPLAKSRLTRTAPVMEEMTIVFSPLLNAKNEIIISQRYQT